MHCNWIGYFGQADGYGRFNTRMIAALQQAGMDVHAIHIGDLDRPQPLLSQMHIDWNPLTISCMPPYMLKKIPGRQWLYSMTEGSLIPPSWVEKIKETGVERVIVPCEHNKRAFRDSGVRVPIEVVPGGTDPEEFSVLPAKQSFRPYTFLTFADRGGRKGWNEVWDAFYNAFGGKTTGNQEVRLIIKVRKGSNNAALMEVMKKAVGADARIIYQIDDTNNIYDTLAQADCLILPSRSEGWGMIQREAACMGLPVITQAYAGLDDGYTQEWALVVESSHMEDIPKEGDTALGQWSIPNFQDIAQKMKYCFYSPETAAKFGRDAASWIRKNQTWEHSAGALFYHIQMNTPMREFMAVR
jgi:glycosyltransferase involved in cell wall biosynthesis